MLRSISKGAEAGNPATVERAESAQARGILVANGARKSGVPGRRSSRRDHVGRADASFFAPSTAGNRAGAGAIRAYC